MTPHTRWALWTAVTVASFTIMETHALRKHIPSGTLSEAIQATLGVSPRHSRRWLLIPVFVCLLGWFGVHILSEPIHMGQLEERV